MELIIHRYLIPNEAWDFSTRSDDDDKDDDDDDEDSDDADGDDDIDSFVGDDSDDIFRVKVINFIRNWFLIRRKICRKRW